MAQITKPRVWLRNRHNGWLPCIHDAFSPARDWGAKGSLMVADLKSTGHPEFEVSKNTKVDEALRAKEAIQDFQRLKLGPSS